MSANLYKKLLNKEESLAVVGLGYVGMPLAVAFAKHLNVIGYDRNEEKIEQYLSGVDPTEEVGNAAVKKSAVEFTYHEEELDRAKFFIVAVPTPINSDKTPDLRPVEGASRTVGRHLSKGSIVVYESTVYPGVTEEICIPILEKESKLKCGVDFKIGYSPERINPGDSKEKIEHKNVAIYGVGNVGKVLAQNMMSQDIPVECFFDKYSKDTDYLGIPVYSICEKRDLSGIDIIIISVSDDYDLICDSLRTGGYCGEIVLLAELIKS